MAEQVARSFKDRYLNDFPQAEKLHVGMDNGEPMSDGSGHLNPKRHWTHTADLLEGNLRLVSPGKYVVISERYAYRRYDYGHLDSIRNTFHKGDILLTRDCEEKDSYGE